MAFCSKCGTQLPDEAGFCNSCGANTASGAPAQGGAPKGFIAEVYTRSLDVLMKKPILLWGISLLHGLLVILAFLFTGFIPLLWLPIILVLELGMASVFLGGYRGKAISSTQLFEGFSKKFFRNAGGMGWKYLWLLIWLLIPIAGIVFYIIKYYSYRFVPYIMLKEPDITATDALKKSMAMTKGYRAKMFGADMLLIAAVVVLTIVFALIALIPFLGPILLVIYYILLIVLLPLLIGVLGAAYYDKVEKENPM